MRAVLEGQPEPPMYFADMKRINRAGPVVLGRPKEPLFLQLDQVRDLLDSGTTLVDARPRESYERGHIPGSYTIPLAGSFSTWAGSVLTFDTPLMVLLPDASRERAREAARKLEIIGMDQLEGVIAPDLLQSWAASEGPLEVVERLSPKELARRSEEGEILVIDIRNAYEWEAEHIPGSYNLPLGRLPEHIDALAENRPTVVYCGTGARALVGVGALKARGLHPILHLDGDLPGWKAEGLPVSKARNVERMHDSERTESHA